MKEKRLTIKVNLTVDEQQRLEALYEVGREYGMYPEIFHAYLFRVGIQAQEERVKKHQEQQG